MPALTASPPGPSQAPKSAGEADAEADSTEGRQGLVRLSPEAIEAAGINVAEVRGGAIARRIAAPGTLAPHADRIAHVAVKLSGIVAELRKNIGDPVEKDEVVAVLESREVADAKSEYLAARLANELQQDLFERDQALWDKRISSEQQFLRSRNEAARTKMRNDIARQKLFALGLAGTEIASLPSQSEATLRHQDIRSPISGRVVERKVERGVALGRDNLETELYVIADLDRVWAELAVSPEDAPLVHIGQPALIAARGGADSAEGQVIFIGPMLDKTTRSARVVAEIGNQDGLWRPGAFVTAAIAVEQREVPLAVPAAAIQTIGNERVAFVRTSEGFQKRPVVLRQGDGRTIEVLSGLRAGETIAVSNTFLLKAEMLKGMAED
jgi:cobalt-zinc-cadmium efflux system membrane fusion protein